MGVDRYRVFQNIWTPCNYNELPGRVILLPGQGMGGTMNSHPRSSVTICNSLMFSCTVVESSYRVVAYNVFIERGNVAVVSHYLCTYRVDKKKGDHC